MARVRQLFFRRGISGGGEIVGRDFFDFRGQQNQFGASFFIFDFSIVIFPFQKLLLRQPSNNDQ
jgi:hypothetical protein